MRRAAALAVLAGLMLAGCGGGEAVEQRPVPAPTVAPAAPSEPSAEALAVRKRLLAEIAAGTYTCGCSAAARAKDRIASGKVKAPPADQLVSALP
jgi:outer membrane murein-binding lipoprotein Lpp